MQTDTGYLNGELFLVEREIPLPPLAVQQVFVAETKAEKPLVNASRDLISRFEKRMQPTFARVWDGYDMTPTEN